MKTVADIPILSGQTFTGHAKEFRTTQAAIFLRLARELGDLGQLRFFKLPLVVLCAPELAHEALVEKQKSFEKSLATKIIFYPFAGRGLFTSEGEAWRKQRKLMAPLFHPRAIDGYAPMMSDIITRCLDDWKDGEIIDAGREMSKITMGVAAKAFFDADTLDESDELSAAVRAMFDYLGEQTGSVSIFVRATIAHLLQNFQDLPAPLERARQATFEALHQPVPLPTARRRRLFAAIRTVDDRIQRMITDRRQKGGDRTDLVSRLLAARDEDDGSFMHDRQVRDEAMTLFIAGHETTATSTTWCLYFLARHPEVYRRWKQEVDSLSGKTPTAEDASRLEYTRGVFREALRLYPPAFAIDRVAAEDVEVGGYHLPKHTSIIVPIHALHRREAIYPDPERFDPARFSAENEAKRPRGAYMPFGAGPRVCIGATFATLEAQLLLAQIAQRFDFEPVSDAPIGPDYATALRPDKPVLLRIRRRRAAG
ncbi:cytochrome P450 [Polyangium sp. 6x1]|uniref:cytochrome P450 n=1 Tax=Polyangium sp. 6x1 TaxID=3042689 RepID=UPI00248249B2|nr:cytochrome P450 [Polyangium sp. 6x1]MDI1447347.1 cytochrome P450 [Polyangium sp. 6x1]